MQENFTPPHSIETEESVFSALMLDERVVSDVMEILKEDDFYKPAHRKIFRAVSDLHAKKEPIDILTVAEQMTKNGDIQDIGGAAFLARILDTAPMATNAAAYAQIIRDKSLLRQMISQAGEITRACMQPGNRPVAEILDSIHQDVLKIRPGGGISDCVWLRDVVMSRIDHYKKIKKEGRPQGVMTGFFKLDCLTYGFQKGELVIIAARPSMGKTAFAQSIVRNVARRGGAALIFSLEMSKEQLCDRDISGDAAVNLGGFKVGRASDSEWTEFVTACDRLAPRRIAICDKTAPSVAEIARISRQMHKKHGLDLVVVDYLQLISGDSAAGRNEEISRISRGLKNIARELDIPVVSLSQLNRNLEQRNNKRPVMSDLRDSGAIEQDADKIIFIYRDEVYNKDENNPNKGKAEIDLAKHRNGSTGVVFMHFHKETAQFVDLSRDADF